MWWSGGIGVVAGLAWLGLLAVRVLDRTLPCVWAGADMVGFAWSPDLPCLRSVGFVGRETWLLGAILATVVAAGVLLAFVRAVVRLAQTHLRIRALLARRCPTSQAARTAGSEAALAGQVIEVVDRRPFAFCYGLLHPRVVISTGLMDLLEGEELVAVLAHERGHLVRRDPLKRLVCRALAELLFFLPALKDLVHRLDLGAELAADRLAITAVGRRPLASALHDVLSTGGVGEFGAEMVLAGIDGVSARIDFLVDGVVPRWRPRWPRLATSSAAAMMVAALVLAGQTVLGDPRVVPAENGSTVEVVPATSR